MSVVDSALAQIRQIQPYQPGKPVEELERELGVSNALKLASNENPLGFSASVTDAITRAASSVELYPDSNAFYLKQKLAENFNVATNQITIGNGSNDVLDLIARTFLGQGTSAIYSQYAFLIYALVTQACGAEALVAKAYEKDHPDAYGHDLDAMLELIRDDTKVIFIANPNNPTGTWTHSDKLRQFLTNIPVHIAVVIDEAYFEYVAESDYPNSLEWLNDFDNLIVTRTFSKIYGLAGLRVGYSVSSPEICDLLNRVRQPFNGNSIALAAALASLEDEDFVNQSRQNNAAGLQQLSGYFDLKNIPYIPSVGNFLTVCFGDTSMDIYQKLLKAGIIVRPVANYGMPDFLRISIGTPEQQSILINQLDKIL